MGSPFSFALSTHAISLWDREEGSINIYERFHVYGQKGIAEWVSSCPEGCLSLSRVGQSSPKPFAECGLSSIKCKSNAGLDPSMGSGLHLKGSRQCPMCLFHGACIYIYKCVLKRKPVAEGRIKNRSLKSQVNLNHWIIFSLLCEYCLCILYTNMKEIYWRNNLRHNNTCVHVCTYI